MKSLVKKIQWLGAMTLFAGIAACADNTDSSKTAALEEALVEKISLDVYKSPTCGCCTKWITHVEASGFETVVHHPADLNQLKSNKGIAPRYQSCHTAVSPNGYVFEGHIPADVIQRFLTNPPPNAIGLAVPGMPIGSPGMEMGSRHDEYDVLLLNKGGSDAVYEQFGGNN